MVVLGVTDETDERIQAYIKRKKPKFPIVQSDEAMEAFGAEYYPSFFLIDADRYIRTNSDDDIPPDVIVNSALELAVRFDDLPADERFVPLRDSWKSKRYAKVATWFEKTMSKETFDAKSKALLTRLHGRFKMLHKRELARIDRLAQGPDFAESVDGLTAMVKQWRGRDVAKSATKTLAKLKRDPTTRKEIASAKKLRALRKRYDPKKHKKSLLKALDAFRMKHRGTWAGRQAASWYARVSRGD